MPGKVREDSGNAFWLVFDIYYSGNLARSFSLVGTDWQARVQFLDKSLASSTSLCRGWTEPSCTWHIQDTHIPAWQEYGTLTPARRPASKMVSLPLQVN